MKRLDRRTFMLLASAGATGAVLTACGNDPDDVDLNPTMIPDVEGAPPTLAPQATPGGGAEAPEEESAGGEAGGDVVTLEAQDPYAWSTNDLEAAPGQVIEITNVGFLEHNFVVEEWGIEEDLPPGEPVEVTVPEDAAVGDSFIYYCSVPGHREGGMEGTLAIVEAGAAAPAEEEAAGGEAAGAGEAVTLEAQDPFAWSAYEFDVAPGQVILATNVGFLEHNFAVEEWGIEKDLPPGEPVEITVPEDAAVGDTFVYFCSVPGHREGGMEGTLTIVEAGAAAPAEESDEAAAEASPEATPEEAAAADDAGPAEGGGEPIVLEADDPFAWSVSEIEAAPGQVIQATNVGFLEHNFTVDELEIAEDLPPGEPVEITIPDDAVVGDTFEFYCSVPGHREGGMVGTLTII